MLGKRFRYEMKSRMNYILVSFVVVLIMSLVFSFVNNFVDKGEVQGSGELEMISTVIIAFSYMVICGVVFFLLTQTINRFNKTFLGDEGYLIHTLPVKESNHVIADFLADFIQVVIAILLEVIFGFIYILSDEANRKVFSKNIHYTMSDFHHSGSNDVEVMLMTGIVFLAMVVVLLYVIWVIKLGINFSKNVINSNSRILPTVVATLIVMVGVILSVLIIRYAWSRGNTLLLQGAPLVSNESVSLTSLGMESTAIVLITHIVMIIAALGANIHILNKKLNLQ